MDPDVVRDPVFQDLLLKAEVGIRKLRDAVVSMRSFYLKHEKSPQDETISEQWRSAALSEEAVRRFEAAREEAAQLLRYAFELSPKSSMFWDMEEVRAARAAHFARLAQDGGWSGFRKTVRGIEERVHIDEGAPVTVVIKPKFYELTEKARKAREARNSKEPAIDPDGTDPAPTAPSDVH